MASKEMEQLKSIMKTMMSSGCEMFGKNIEPLKIRATMEAAQLRMPKEPGITFTQENANEVAMEKALPVDSRADGAIIYIHGGGFVCGNVTTSRSYAGVLASETKMPVYTVTYRLAPENKYPAGVDDCFTAYCHVLEENEGIPVFLIGESAGATLVLTTAIRAKKAGVRMPAGLIPYSPVVDISGMIDRSANEGKDFTVTSEGLEAVCGLYCQDESQAKDPCVSPIYADYEGFPPMLLAWDESETLAADSEALKKKAEEAGVEVHAKSYPDCFHAFATTGRGTPESREILADTVSFIHEKAEMHQ